MFNPQPLVPIRSAHAGQIEKTLVDIHTASTQKLATMEHQLKHLQLLIIILPEVSGSYGELYQIVD